METLPEQPQPEDSIKMELPHVGVRWVRLPPPVKSQAMLRYENSERTCRLIFCLDGCLRANHLVRKTDEHQQICSGCYGLLATPCRCRCLACSVQSDTRVVDVRYERDYLRQLLGGSGLRRTLRMAASPGGPLQTVKKITPAMNYILRLMEDHIVQRKANPLFVMAKALELMWLFTDSLYRTNKELVNPADCKAVQNAQAILEKNLTAAPSMAELAAHVGMSVSKLKQIFPRLCGLTPYAYLRQARMERAMYLLHHAGMNVTEVALEVGYASPSRFSRAFAEHFGFNPSRAKQSPEYCFFRTGTIPGDAAGRDETAAQCRHGAAYSANPKTRAPFR